jgi:photosystem II stability/assembly factor-like uncharacterized protein
MKGLFVSGFATIVVLFLLIFALLKESDAREIKAEARKSFAGLALRDMLPVDPLAEIPFAEMKRNKSKIINIVLKSTDNGQTWQGISKGMPKIEQPVNFFAGKSDLYLHVKDVMYHSKSSLETPVWKVENVPDLQAASFTPSTSIAFSRSGTMAFNHQGQIYKKVLAAGTWLPIHTTLKQHAVRTIFETSNGAVFIGCDQGLYKSIDEGKNWKKVQRGLVMNLAESEGVLIATGGKGIMRSTDNGEHWQWVIREGGVGIAVEKIRGGFAAISYNTETKSRKMRISLDSGKTWQAIDEGLRPSSLISSIKQAGQYLICGHPDGIYRSSNMGKTWNRVYEGVDKNLFRIYVSGDVLYAVLGGAGC